MRIENPTFAMTQQSNIEPQSVTPDVARTQGSGQTGSPPRLEPMTPAQVNGTGDKTGLVEGSGKKDVVYIRGFSFSTNRVWQALTALFLGLFLVMVIAYATGRGEGGGGDTGIVPPVTPQPQVKPPPQCEDRDCLYQAADILRMMNLSANPCDDFFNYACGNFKDVVSSQQSLKSSFSVSDWLKSKNDDMVVQLLETKVSDSAYSVDSSEWKLKNLYASCMNGYDNMKHSGKIMVKMINQLGGLDVFGTWSERDWNFSRTFRSVHTDHWTDAMLNFYWTTNPRNPATNMLKISGSGMGIPYISAYLNPDFPPYVPMMDAYREAISDVLALLVRDSEVNVTALNRTCNDPDCIQDFVNDVIDIETKLANITAQAGPVMYRRVRRRRLPRQSILTRLLRLRPPRRVNRITLGELSRRVPQIEWHGLFEDLMGKDVVSDSTPVEIPVGRFMDRLGTLIGSESKRALHHYLMWTMVRRHLLGMGADYVYQYQKMKEKIHRIRVPQSRQDYCVGLMDKHMGEAIGMLFVRDHIGMEALKQAANLTELMLDAFRTSYVNWMTDEVRFQAQKVLNNTAYHFGYPKWILDLQELDNYYEALNILPDNFFQNMKNIDLFKRIQLRNKIQYGNNRQRWTIKATHADILSSSVSAYVAVPAGMLQPPIFAASLPHYVNVAALGTLLGKHLSRFTVTNNESQIADRVWWDQTTFERYQPYKSCVLDLYRNHTLKMSGFRFVGGARTQVNPERAAGTLVDLHYSLSVAYSEHRRYTELTEEPRLPGLQHETTDQTFFLAFAQSQCSTGRSKNSEYLLHRLAGIVPSRLMVNTALFNHPGFRRAYQCTDQVPPYNASSCTL